MIGAGFRSIFIGGFSQLSPHAQIIDTATLYLMILAMGILLLPAPYHFMVERGENTNALHELITYILKWALFPFALGLGASVFTVAEKTISVMTGAIAGTFTFLFAISIWYVLSTFRRRSIVPPSNEEPTTLTDRIREVLIEARMILPGAQALLAFRSQTR